MLRTASEEKRAARFGLRFFLPRFYMGWVLLLTREAYNEPVPRRREKQQRHDRNEEKAS